MNLRSDVRDWLIEKGKIGTEEYTFISRLCCQIDQIEEEMRNQVRARDVLIKDFTSDTAEGSGRNMPVEYRRHGGTTYAVCGTSSITYLEKLEEQIMGMLRDKDRQKQLRMIDALKTISVLKGVDYAQDIGTLRAYLQTFQEIAQKALGDDEFSWATRRCSKCGETRIIVFYEGSKPVCRECREKSRG